MTIEYQIVRKQKKRNKEEVVGRTFSKEQAKLIRDHYNDNNEDFSVYYLILSVNTKGT